MNYVIVLKTELGKCKQIVTNIRSTGLLYMDDLHSLNNFQGIDSGSLRASDAWSLSSILSSLTNLNASVYQW